MLKKEKKKLRGRRRRILRGTKNGEESEKLFRSYVHLLDS